MRRIPIIPTIMVALAVATMIGLGIWQLQRLAWKERMIADLSRRQAYSAVTLDCRFDGTPDVRAAKSAAGQIGYGYFLPCRSGGTDYRVNLGWSQRPDLLPAVRQSGRFAGTLLDQGGNNHLVVLDTPLPPLAPSGRPEAADLPNNHLAYAGQWFLFAAAAAIIYVLALRRRAKAP